MKTLNETAFNRLADYEQVRGVEDDPCKNIQAFVGLVNAVIASAGFVFMGFVVYVLIKIF